MLGRVCDPSGSDLTLKRSPFNGVDYSPRFLRRRRSDSFFWNATAPDARSPWPAVACGPDPSADGASDPAWDGGLRAICIRRAPAVNAAAPIRGKARLERVSRARMVKLSRRVKGHSHRVEVHCIFCTPMASTSIRGFSINYFGFLSADLNVNRLARIPQRWSAGGQSGARAAPDSSEIRDPSSVISAGLGLALILPL